MIVGTTTPLRYLPLLLPPWAKEQLWEAVLGGGAQHGNLGKERHPQMRPSAEPPGAGAGPQRRADVVRELPPRRERQPGRTVPGEEGG